MKLSVVVALVATICGVVICKSFAIPIYEASEGVNRERPIDSSKEYKPICKGEGGTCTKQSEGALKKEGVNRDSPKQYKPICEGEGGTCTKQSEGAPSNDRTDRGRISEADTSVSARASERNAREQDLKEIIRRLECRYTPDLCKSESSYQGSAGPRNGQQEEVHNRSCRLRPEMCKNDSSSKGGTGSREGNPRIQALRDIIHHEDCRYDSDLCKLTPAPRGVLDVRRVEDNDTPGNPRKGSSWQDVHDAECRKRPEKCYPKSSFQVSARASERNAREQDLKEIIRRLECRYTPDLCKSESSYQGKLDEKRIADNDLKPAESVYDTRGGAGQREGNPRILQALRDIIHHEDCRYDPELCKLKPSLRGSAGRREENVREQDLRQIHDLPDCEYTNSKEECALLSSLKGSAGARERNTREQDLKEIIRRLECRYTPDLCKSESYYQDNGDLQDQRRANFEFASDDWEPKLQERYFGAPDEGSPQIQGRAYDYYASDKWEPKLQERYLHGPDEGSPQFQGRSYDYYARDKWEPKLEERYFGAPDEGSPQIQGSAYNDFASDKREPKLQERYFEAPPDTDRPQVQGRAYNDFASDKWEPKLEERYFEKPDNNTPQFQRSAYNDFASDKWEPKLEERYFQVHDNNTPQFQRSAYSDFASDKWEPKLEGRYFRVPENEESPDARNPQVKRDSIYEVDSGVSQVEKSLSEVAERHVDKNQLEANRKTAEDLTAEIEFLRDRSIDKMSSSELLAYLTELARDRRQQQT